jgi:hypothetical protein
MSWMDAPAAQPVDKWLDAGKSFLGGIGKTISQMAAQNAPGPPVLSMLKQAVDTADFIDSLVHGKVTMPKVVQLGAPEAQVAETALGSRYTPQTRAGKAAQTAGMMAPAALAPGSATQRVVNVVAPTVGAEATAELVKALGGDEHAQDMGRTVGGIAGGLAGSVRTAPSEAPKPMDLDTLKAAKDQAYRAVDDMGAAYKPEAVQTLKQGIGDAMEAASMDPDLHPKVAATVRLVTKKLGGEGAPAEPVTLSDLDKVRQLVRRGIFDGGGTKDEKRLGGQILGEIDDFIGAAGPEQMAGGEGPAAADAIETARDLNTRVRKVEAVTDAVNKADLRAASTGAGGNADNATRQNLRRVLETQKGLTGDEKAALDAAVRGSDLQNALRLAGKLSPTHGMLPSVIGLGATAVSHGPGVALPAAGMVAKLASDAMTRSALQRVLDIMALGGSADELPPTTLPRLKMAPGVVDVRGVPVPAGALVATDQARTR